MKRIACIAALLAVIITAGACSSAGPFVTSISSDGNGGIIVEKAMVQYDRWTATIRLVHPTTTRIKLFPPQTTARKPKAK